MPVITLTTDFGLADAYVGVMKGVILSIVPQAVLVDICHEIPPQAISTAAFILYQAAPYFPPDAIHLVVVDPGVGSARHAVAVKTQCGVFVAPDNGVLSMVLEDASTVEAVRLKPLVGRPASSATFQGRDLFAPAAAHLAAGMPLASLGSPATELVQSPVSHPDLSHKGEVIAHVIHVDSFGNLILDAIASHLGDTCRIRLGEREIDHLSKTYAEVESRQLVAYIGSTRNHLEIAVRNGDAAKTLGLRVGDAIHIQTEGGQETWTNS